MDVVGTPGGSDGSRNRNPAASNNEQSLAMLKNLQQQIPGFGNIPSPQVFSQQKSSDQGMKEPLKGVSRSNLFVQCINRDGVQKGLQTDEQAGVRAQPVHGYQQPEGKVYTNEHTGYPPPTPPNTAPWMQNGSFVYPYEQSQQTQQPYRNPVTNPAYVTYPHPSSYMHQMYGNRGVSQDVNAKDIQNQPKTNPPIQHAGQETRVDRAWKGKLDMKNDRGDEFDGRKGMDKEGDKVNEKFGRRGGSDSERHRDKVDRDVRNDAERKHDRVRSHTGRDFNRTSYSYDKSVGRKTHLDRNNDRGRDRRSDMRKDWDRDANRRADMDRRGSAEKRYSSGEITKERSEEQADNLPSLEKLQKKKSEYESYLQDLQDKINSLSQKSEKQDLNSESSVFKRPFAPPVAKSRSTLSNASGPTSEKQRKFSKDNTSLPPPVSQDVKHNEKSRRESNEPDASKTTTKNSCIRGPRQPCQGGTVSDFIANFITTVCKSKDGVQIVASKYKLPGNCIGLLPPKMIQDVWSILNKPTQIRDEMLQDVERWLALGVIPIVILISLFGKGPQPLKDIRRMTSDALTVLGYVCRCMSIKRRLLMRNALNKKYAVLCRTSNCMSDYIFGDKIANDLIEIKLGTYSVQKSKEDDNDDMFALNYKTKFCAALALIGPDADVNVAGMVNMACANDGVVEDLREKYQIPSNCNCLLPSKINPEIWSLLSPSGLDVDHRLQDVHLCIAEGMVPLMKLLQSVHDKKYDHNVGLGSLTDALALLGNAIFQINNVRMDVMMKSLPEEAHGFCRWYWAGAEEVSGDRLEEELKVRDESGKSKMVGVMLEVVKSQKTQPSNVSRGSSYTQK